MLHTTRGIVLQTFSYTDTSVIAKIYTELFGLQSYLVNAAHSKRSGTKANLLQPLSLIECVVYKKEKKQLQRMKEIKCEHPFVSIPYEITKSSIALFLNEILYKSIREEERNPELFEFIHSSLRMLDLRTESCANFHLHFMVRLSRYLGFYPSGNFSDGEMYFDLQEGVFRDFQPSHPLWLDPAQSTQLRELMSCTYANLSVLSISLPQRKLLLDKLILYYELHLDSLRGVRSHKVLEEIF
jgi:DNA repair protein RecO (recombination protein O)